MNVNKKLIAVPDGMFHISAAGPIDNSVRALDCMWRVVRIAGVFKIGTKFGAYLDSGTATTHELTCIYMVVIRLRKNSGHNSLSLAEPIVLLNLYIKMSLS